MIIKKDIGRIQVRICPKFPCLEVQGDEWAFLRMSLCKLRSHVIGLEPLENKYDILFTYLETSTFR